MRSQRNVEQDTATYLWCAAGMVCETDHIGMLQARATGCFATCKFIYGGHYEGPFAVNRTPESRATSRLNPIDRGI